MPDVHQHIDCAARGINTGSVIHAIQNRRQSGIIFIWEEQPCRHLTEVEVYKQTTMDAPNDVRCQEMVSQRPSYSLHSMIQSGAHIRTFVKQQTAEATSPQSFHKQKPWITRTIQDAINTGPAAYNVRVQSGNMDTYIAAVYSVRSARRQKGTTGRKWNCNPGGQSHKHVARSKNYNYVLTNYCQC